MRLKYIGLAICLIAILSGCDEDDDDVNLSPFAGTWNVVFAGGLIGTDQITINGRGHFMSGTMNLNVRIAIEGDVSSSGAITNGRIFHIDADESGAVLGNFTVNTGSGTYVVITIDGRIVAAGTWSASRQ